MELQVFNFTNNTLDELKKLRPELIKCSDILDDFFFNLLEHSCDGFFNISTRVKSSFSLKEKIIRQNYYIKYDTPKDLLNNLSDLIGIRVECRFIEDEKLLFDFIKTNFNLINDEGFNYSTNDSNIFLDLKEKQPLKQKNGFELYRIDGYMLNNGLKCNFELQIKSMVNTFWGEIEHKIIYKNYNMIFGDEFYKNILNSIKSNLCLIDNQLLTIFNHINSSNVNLVEQGYRKESIEILLSKMIFDIYSYKVKEELGVSIDFRNACDIIIDYIISKNNCNTGEDYYRTFINTSIRLQEIFENPISFKDKLYIGDYLEFSSHFSQCIGENLAYSMNHDFHWNLFFKILFEIEPGNNYEDFTTFIKYLETIFSNRDSYLNLYLKFSSNEVENIKFDLLQSIAQTFITINSIKYIYRDKLNQVFLTIDKHIDFLCEYIPSYANYVECIEIYNLYLYLKILSIFNYKIKVSKILDFLKTVQLNKSCLRITTKGIKYLHNLDCNSTISTNDILDYIYIR